MIEAGAPSTEEATRKLRLCIGEVPAPPGIVMLAPPEVPRNAERAQCEGRAKGRSKSAAEASIKAGAPQSPGQGS
jgi:hypothetical protein